MTRAATIPILAIALVLLPTTMLGAERSAADAPLQRSADRVVRGGPAGLDKAALDSVTVFGGPGTLEGKFETAGGLPDLQGWESVDHTMNDVLYWHPSTFHAADLDPGTPGNHAWWCGDVFDPCDPDDPEAGYGNDWNQVLRWSGPVADPALATTVTVTAEVAYDTEDGYDFLRLELVTPDAVEVVWSGSGREEHLAFADTFPVAPSQYMDGEVHLRWRFESDGGYSDRDCEWPTEFGAAQIDRIAVTFDQGDGPVSIGPLETAEPGDPSWWEPATPVGVGDFAKVWQGLDDIDPCLANPTPQLAFIDDGEVQPGTGGSMCNTWCYGPGGYVVNHTGGLVGESELLYNMAWSPPIPLPGDPRTGASLSFDIFEHNGFAVQNPAEIFWYWAIDSTDDPAGQEGWTGPRNHGFLREGGPTRYRFECEVGDLLAPGARWVRVGLGVRQGNFGWTQGDESTPAPYFDNVRLDLHAAPGPVVEVDRGGLAQDGFPAGGSIDGAQLGAAGVRFDTARDIALSIPGIVAGDSVVLRISPTENPGQLVRPARMHYRLIGNPVFDAYRTSGLAPQGYVEGDTVAASAGGYVRYAFDLPDEGFLFPGDRLHYFFTATEDSDGQPFTTIVPSDTTGYSDDAAPGLAAGPAYDPRFVVRALPTLRSSDPADRPDLLVWLRDTSAEVQNAWLASLAALGVREGAEFDLFVSHEPGSDGANGLGYNASPELLAGYRTVLLEASNNPVAFSGIGETGSDTAALDGWLRLGGRSLLVAGDAAVADLMNDDPPFLDDWLGVLPASSGGFLEALGGQILPAAVVSPGAAWPVGLPGWLVSGCKGDYELPTFHRPRMGVELMEIVGGDATRLAEFGTEAREVGAYPYAALAVNEVAAHDATVVTLPTGLVRVTADPHHAGATGPLPARTALLGEILSAFGHAGGSPVVGAPSSPGRLAMTAFPNPFNPAVTLALAVPRAGTVQVDVYDLRGRFVRRLVDGPQQAGPLHVEWRGDDQHGRPVGAGVYFARAVLGAESVVSRLALLK